MSVHKQIIMRQFDEAFSKISILSYFLSNLDIRLHEININKILEEWLLDNAIKKLNDEKWDNILSKLVISTLETKSRELFHEIISYTENKINEYKNYIKELTHAKHPPPDEALSVFINCSKVLHDFVIFEKEKIKELREIINKSLNEGLWYLCSINSMLFTLSEYKIIEVLRPPRNGQILLTYGSVFQQPISFKVNLDLINDLTILFENYTSLNLNDSRLVERLATWRAENKENEIIELLTNKICSLNQLQNKGDKIRDLIKMITYILIRNKQVCLLDLFNYLLSKSSRGTVNLLVSLEIYKNTHVCVIPHCEVKFDEDLLKEVDLVIPYVNAKFPNLIIIEITTSKSDKEIDRKLCEFEKKLLILRNYCDVLGILVHNNNEKIYEERSEQLIIAPFSEFQKILEKIRSEVSSNSSLILENV
ncbi:MAG: hypothetical protein NXY59_00060 [Aigarchaeota archaeon]|nr:hypothetical protein [Candidatus Pelearchaeum maunauluense]